MRLKRRMDRKGGRTAFVGRDSIRERGQLIFLGHRHKQDLFTLCLDP